MKILVLSDSHGAVSPMEQAVEQTSPDLILHLGDCWRDGERLHDRFPSIPLEQVPGNCDFRPTEPAERLLELRGKRILLCHGHAQKADHRAPGDPAERQRQIKGRDLVLPTSGQGDGGAKRHQGLNAEDAHDKKTGDSRAQKMEGD